jgi:myo-inositol 2-dehydrogenase/D-chiro-inositol 1-dehydrogenase
MKIGVAGVGRIGVHHVESLRSLADVTQVVVADATASRAEQVAASLGVTAAPSAAALVESGVDALVIAAPTPAHAELLRLAAEARLPAFCEKPVALDLETLDSVIADVADAGILVQVGFQRRFDAGYRAARDAVAAGAAGTLIAVRAATHDPVPPAEEYIGRSGGIFRDLSIHDLDAIRFVTGREIVEVYADGAVRQSEAFARYGDVDTAAAVLRLDDGSLGVLTGSRFDARGYDARLEVFGAADTLAVGVDGRVAYRSTEPGVPAPETGYASFMDRFRAAYSAELAAFVSVVRDGGPTPCSLADARAALATAIAAERARTEHRPVLIEEVALTGVA